MTRALCGFVVLAIGLFACGGDPKSNLNPTLAGGSGTPFGAGSAAPSGAAASGGTGAVTDRKSVV